MLDFSKQHVAPASRRGLFTIEQYLVLNYRARGYTQLETAKALSMSRANVSMIESRARKKLRKARMTVRAYYSFFKSTSSVVVEEGTRLQDVPRVVLNEADRLGIHLRSNMVDILRMAKTIGPNFVQSGSITKDLRFDFNPSGKLYLVSRKKKR